MAASATSDAESERYKACMVLSAVGDALGYMNSDYEFNYSDEAIHADVMRRTGGQGVQALCADFPGVIVSDDTIMHLATAEALLEAGEQAATLARCAPVMAKHYKLCMQDMDERAPGNTTLMSMGRILPDGSNWDCQPFNPRGAGCGAAMRSMCLGLRFPRPEQEAALLALAVESGRVTHHNPAGFMGAVVSALFTAYALRGLPVHSWGAQMMTEALPRVKEYVREAGRAPEENLADFGTFERTWTILLRARGIEAGKSAPRFPAVYDVLQRRKFYDELASGNWPGARGHDSTAIAYDALLGCGGSWEEFCLRGVLHGGDNDSTGAIGGAWFGALYGFRGVPPRQHEKLEYLDRLTADAKALLAHSRIA